MSTVAASTLSVVSGVREEHHVVLATNPPQVFAYATADLAMQGMATLAAANPNVGIAWKKCVISESLVGYYNAPGCGACPVSGQPQIVTETKATNAPQSLIVAKVN